MESEMDAELRFHIDARAEDLLRGGMPRAEALRRARIEFGGMDKAREECREARGVGFAESLLQDLRFALRMLRKNPGFSAITILTLTLGIGANTAIFSVVNAIVLQPLPVEQPNELVFLQNARYGPGQSFPNYRDIRDRNRTFAGLTGYRIAPMEFETPRGADRIWGYLATGNYFQVLGVQPVLGRLFNAEDDLLPGASPYAVLSYKAWQSRFGGDRQIVGQTIRLNRLPYTVLGVAPPDFHGTELFYWPDVWVPMMMEPRIESIAWLEERNSWNTWVVGRLKGNVSTDQAQADLNAIAKEMAREFPDVNDGLQFKLTKPGLIGDMIGGPAKAFALGVFLLASMVLLGACANLASLFAARTTDRQHEMAIRLAIGAGRRRVMRQILTETMILSLLGGTCGYLLASLLSQALSRWHAPMDFPIQFAVIPDWRVFLFALAGTIIAGLLFGTAPAWRISKADPQGALRGAQATRDLNRVAFRDLLVVVQVALCFVLVSASFLSLRGLQRALKTDLGFVPDHVVTAAFELNLAGYPEGRGRAFQQQALQTIQQLPGVQSAAYSNSVPLSFDQSQTSVFPADKADLRLSDRIGVTFYQVSPEFFATMGTKMLAGREFSWHDDTKSPQVAIVNLAFAERVLHTGDAVGKRFRGGVMGPFAEVIGVVEDGKYGSLTESREPAVFWSALQSYNSTTTLEVKSFLPTAQTVGAIREALARLDPSLPLYGTGSLRQMLGLAFFPPSAAALALSAFGVLAIMLAATGIHGLVTYAVSRRTREIGIRMAVGARRVQVVWLILRRTAVLLALGSLAGLALGLAAGRAIANIVQEAHPGEPIVVASVWIALTLLGVFSSWAPVRRATRVEPVVALRCE